MCLGNFMFKVFLLTFVDLFTIKSFLFKFSKRFTIRALLSDADMNFFIVKFRFLFVCVNWNLLQNDLKDFVNLFHIEL